MDAEARSRREEEAEELSASSSVKEKEVESPEIDEEDESTLDHVGATPLSASQRRAAACTELAEELSVESTSSYLDSYATAFDFAGHVLSSPSVHKLSVVVRRRTALRKALTYSGPSTNLFV